MRRERKAGKTVVALALLYGAQGVPFGFATEYLPVVLREHGYSYAAIASLFWLQLPWQLKIVWAKVADHPRIKPRARELIVVLQVALACTVAAFATRSLTSAPAFWFVLTALAAALAATQDVFVDALAVRTLAKEDRGFGNTAQVAGYRAGMLVGGAGLLLAGAKLGEHWTLLGCALLVACASIGAFMVMGESADGDDDAQVAAQPRAIAPSRLAALVSHMLRRDTIVVLLVALTFKLGLHMASALLKPMAVDYGWTRAQIGYAMVTVGSVGALLGALVGGGMHRWLGEPLALAVGVLVQALVCVPLIFVERLHAPLGLTTFAIAIEHFGSGLGTTVLFAALMTATRPADAGLHYTVLTSANALSIGLGSMASGLLADHVGKLGAFVTATVVCALPWALLPRWERAAHASAQAPAERRLATSST